MAFLRQLRLLLWKNLTIKLRTRLATFLELFLPLALCVLLVILRTSQPVQLERKSEYEPKPLPSAGWISMIENTCDNYVLDENRFRIFPHASTKEFLALLDEIVRLNITSDAVPSRKTLQYLSQTNLFDSITKHLKPSIASAGNKRRLGMFEILAEIVIDDLIETYIRNMTFQKLEHRTTKTSDDYFLAAFTSEQHFRDYIGRVVGGGVDENGQFHLALPSNQMSGHRNIEPIERVLYEIKADNVTVEQLEDGVVSHFLQNTTAGERLRKHWRNVDEVRSRIDSIKWLYSVVKYFPLSEQCANKYIEHRTSDTKTFKDVNDGSDALRYLWTVGQIIFCGETFPSAANNPSQMMFEKLTKNEGIAININRTSKFDVYTWNSEQETYMNKFLGGHPRIFYAPNETVADDIIREMNRTFVLLDDGQKYANQILKFTSKLKSSLTNSPTEWSSILKRFYRPFLDSGNSRRARVGKLWSTSDKILGMKDIIGRIERIQAVACTYREVINGTNLNLFEGFKDESDLVHYALNEAPYNNITVFTSVIFDTPNATLPPHVTYKIRQNVSMTPTTRSAQALFKYPGPRDYDDSYYKFGFLFIQDLVERAIIDVFSGGVRDNHPILEPGSYIQEAPFPCYLYDAFLLDIQSVFSFILSISWVYSVALLVQSIVHEKEKHLSEVMYVMGMNRNVLWTSWFLTVFIMMTFTMILMTLLLWLGRLLPLSSPLFVFVLLELFGAASLLMGIMLSTLYEKAKLATACGGIVFFTSCLPCLFISIREQSLMTLVSFWIKLICSFSSTSAFGIASKYLLYYEINGEGCDFHNFYISPIEGEQFTVAHVMLMLVVDCILYALIALLIDTVFGSGRHTAIRCKLRLHEALATLKGKFECLYGGEPFTSSICSFDSDCEIQHDDWIEMESENEEAFVVLEGISKKYANAARKYALRDLSLKLYKNQVTALLGHNGAGKTTAMNIITGVSAPTSGSVIINGHRIQGRKDVLNLSLGTCPQHNVLFSNLTVYEHLSFYAKLKSSMSSKDAQEEVEQMLADLQLRDKRNELVDTLSGGMKRRLSVAIAFIGESTIVILDEPTAGVDPFARRAIWEMITKCKKGRSILIATHLMDEADILSDRIAVISHGQLRALGSPLFLKQRLGDGYFLTVVTEQLRFSTEGKSDSGSSSSLQKKSSGMTQEDHLFSQNFIKHCSKFGKPPVLIKSYADEKTYQLREWKECEIIALLEALEDDSDESLRKDLQISSFGIRDTTLDEIFMKISTAERSSDVTSTTDDCSHDSSMEDGLADSDSTCSKTGIEQVCLQLPHVKHVHRRGVTLLQQYFWILWKRYRCVTRSWKTRMSQLLLPAIFVAGGMSIALPLMIYNDSPPLEMSTFQFVNLSKGNETSTVYYSNEDFYEVPYNDSCYVNTSSIATSLYGVPGIGSDCLVANPADTWLDANWPSSQPFLHRIVNASYLLENCRWRRNFDSNFKEKRLYEFILPNYLSPTSKGPGSSYTPDCWCEKRGGALFCSQAPNENHNYRLLVTGDRLYDLTGILFTDYIVNTANEFELRFGGFSVGFQKQNVPMGYGVNASANLRLLGVRHLSKVWFNNRAFHAMPIFLNVHNNALLRASLRNNPNYSSVNPASFGITLINHPMEGSTEVISVAKIMQGNDVLIAVFLVVGMSFVPASFIYFLVYERSSLSLHVQWMAGLSSTVYWIANCTWDILNYFIPVLVCTCIIWMFNIPLYVRLENLLGVVSLLIMYGLSTTPIVYLMSFCFDDPSNAYIAMVLLNLFTGICTCFTSYLLEVFGLHNQSIASAEKVLRHIFLIFPGFCLGRGVLDIALNDYRNQYYEFLGEWSNIRSPFNWDSLYLHITVMGVIGISALLLTILMECALHADSLEENERLLTETGNEDTDVSAERVRILSGEADDDAIRVEALTKVYHKRRMRGVTKNVIAVDRIYLAVKQGECFGLLGVNGAGKTTVFKMLTRIIKPTNGSVYSSNKNMYAGRQLLQQIGYCPQFDALFEELTAREHLIYYARIHGFKTRSVKKMTTWLLKNIGLEEYADIEASAYSGGTKRKLSVAIALIGDPKIIFLDEPTAGMDPRARQFIQSVIKGLSAAGKSILLTSHSMEECEALCGRLSIMVNGRLRCLGTSQHLKDKYGDGYSVRLRLNKDADMSIRDAIQAFFIKRIPTVQIKETHFAYVHLEVREVALNELFSICSEAVHEYGSSLSIESYSISQNNLDNVFISFVREQNESLHSSMNARPTVMSCPVAEDPASRSSSAWDTLTRHRSSSWQQGDASPSHSTNGAQVRSLSASFSDAIR